MIDRFKFKDVLEREHRQLEGYNHCSKFLEEHRSVVIDGKITNLIEDGSTEVTGNRTLETFVQGVRILHGTRVNSGNAGYFNLGVDDGVVIGDEMIYVHRS
jgi:hypothetical protein